MGAVRFRLGVDNRPSYSSANTSCDSRLDSVFNNGVVGADGVD